MNPGAAALRSRAVHPPAGPLPQLRQAFERLADSLRRSDRFSRMRVGVVGAWAVASLATVFFACPPAGPGNSTDEGVGSGGAARPVVAATKR